MWPNRRSYTVENILQNFYITEISLFSEYSQKCSQVHKSNNHQICSIKKIVVSILITVMRSSHQTCSVTKGVLRNFAKFTGKHLCQVSFLRKRSWHRCFPVNFTKFLRTLFYRTHPDDCFCHSSYGTSVVDFELINTGWNLIKFSHLFAMCGK